MKKIITLLCAALLLLGASDVRAVCTTPECPPGFDGINDALRCWKIKDSVALAAERNIGYTDAGGPYDALPGDFYSGDVSTLKKGPAKVLCDFTDTSFDGNCPMTNGVMGCQYAEGYQGGPVAHYFLCYRASRQMEAQDKISFTVHDHVLSRAVTLKALGLVCFPAEIDLPPMP